MYAINYSGDLLEVHLSDMQRQQGLAVEAMFGRYEGQSKCNWNRKIRLVGDALT